MVAQPPIPIAASPSHVDKIIFDKNGLRIQVQAKQSPDGAVAAECYFSNSAPSAITGLVFQVAVPAVMQLQMDAASGNILPPKSVNSVMQTFRVVNPTRVRIILIH
jgi:hypothetical protein